MKHKSTTVTILAFIFALVFAANTMADDSDVNIPIAADQAFDAVVRQVDPETGLNERVALIDVRTTAEYYWVGACGKVESILTTSDEEYIPYNGKVVLNKRGTKLRFKVAVNNRLRRVRLPVTEVDSIETTDISIHIPTHIWDEEKCTKFSDDDFAAQIESLSDDYDVLILMCRSGKRSATRAFDTSLFKAIYEIDQPDGSNGYGGFQGSSFGDAYNGYRGFPGRNTRQQDTQSVSWSDAGLPVHIGWTPFSPDFSPAEEAPY